MRFAWVGTLFGGLFAILVAALFVGGISYRKDCLTPEMNVRSDWSFTVLAPIPYLFRPSEPGCKVHTGTRVALSGLGIGRIPAVEPKQVITDAVDNAELRYNGYLRLALARLERAAASASSPAESEQAVRQFAGTVETFDVPFRLRRDHRQLVAEANDLGRMWDLVNAAAANEDARDLQRHVRAADAVAAKLDETLRRLDRLSKQSLTE